MKILCAALLLMMCGCEVRLLPHDHVPDQSQVDPDCTSNLEQTEDLDVSVGSIDSEDMSDVLTDDVYVTTDAEVVDESDIVSIVEEDTEN